MNNTLRIRRASAALRAYVKLYGSPDEATPRDLISDLLHYMSQQGKDIDSELRMAHMNYHAEVLEEADEESDGECSFNSNGVCTVCGLKDKR